MKKYIDKLTDISVDLALGRTSNSELAIALDEIIGEMTEEYERDFTENNPNGDSMELYDRETDKELTQ